MLTDEQMKRISELLKKGNDVVIKMVKDSKISGQGTPGRSSCCCDLKGNNGQGK